MPYSKPSAAGVFESKGNHEGSIKTKQRESSKVMKMNAVVLTLMGMAMFALATPTLAEDKKEITITGEAKCAKCVLKEGEKCQNVIQTKEDGQTVSYYLAKNEVSKNFNENLCKDGKKVTATGTVKTADGKKELMASKIALAK
jgi:hypothetical protein